ncbi:NAD(P)-binding protein [Epithele typhae]|uniref:NAD(P)-binding protein n=1 Tax=Epithele typhae TaxID=378194 RepID=UPI00200874C7|nr:NAD(P)-binding protein [Epithele typhae]KAH9925644.1 NAD(P)-binding protein [Epithele typhae]
MDLGLDNVHVLVTGASGGIGLATVRTFLKLGARVTAHYHSKRAPLEPLLAEFGGERVRAAQANLALEADAGRLFADAPSAFGPVQVVVVNHAVYEARNVPLAEMPLAQWESTARRRRARAGGGRAHREHGGKYGEAGHADYAATKSAMMYGLCLSLKNEIVKIAPKGRVNVVAPGWVRTPMAEESLKNPDIVYQALATMPLKKVAEPEDVANQIAILSSSTVSGHVSGTVVMVEGGMEGRLLNSRQELGL